MLNPTPEMSNYILAVQEAKKNPAYDREKLEQKGKCALASIDRRRVLRRACRTYYYCPITLTREQS